MGCQERHPRAEFYANRAAPSGLQSSCKAAQRRWRQANRSRVVERARAAHLRRAFGLTVDQFREIAAGGCGVCGATDALHVDHDHATGTVRGVLCGNHNRGLGLFQDRPDFLRAAADYLERHVALDEAL